MSALRDDWSPPLLDRLGERQIIDELLDDVRHGRSRSMVLRGEPGVGKSALLAYLADRATGSRIETSHGVESELELAYSGLHQLCAPMLDHLDLLSEPQQNALSLVFGQSAGAPPEQFLVGLAVLALVAEVAEAQPLICLVDDAQWLDRASAQVLTFVARRLAAERVAIVCSARTDEGDAVLSALPTRFIGGLPDREARALLRSSLPGPLDADVAAQIIAESRGNPLAILELPRTWGPTNVAGGFGLPGSEPLSVKIEQSYKQRLGQLPADTQLLVLTAAAEPLGDPRLLQRASRILGLDMAAAAPAIDAGLLEIAGRVTFAHSLVRSAAYRAAGTLDRQQVHAALAEATDSVADPDRCAWHRSQATLGPSEAVAEELERSAERAQARGGMAAAAAFLTRATSLTADPVQRVRRALAGADASLQAGAYDAALELVGTAQSGPLDERQRAQTVLLRARIAFGSGAPRDAARPLMDAARRLESFDPDLSRETYLVAWAAATFAGRHAREELAAISGAIIALPARSEAPGPLDLLLEGLALLVTKGHAAAATTLQRATEALKELPLDDVLRWGGHAAAASDAIWDDDGSRSISQRNSALVREIGAAHQLLFSIQTLASSAVRRGDFADAAVHIAEAASLADAIGARFGSHAELRLVALQGKVTEARALINRTLEEAEAGGMDLAANIAHWAAAILGNGLGRYDEAANAAQLACDSSVPFVATWALPELVEAAVRVGAVDLARGALERLTETTQPCGSDWAMGIEARSRALLGIDRADELYLEAIDRLGRSGMRPDLARAHLLYGEWLRRQGRRIDARAQLRASHDLCAEVGMEAFGERARRELAATGERVRRRRDDQRVRLTPQEEQIARLARDGLSNPEIGAALFLSPRTVEWHLRKVFTKLGISSRNELESGLLSTQQKGDAL